MMRSDVGNEDHTKKSPYIADFKAVRIIIGPVIALFLTTAGTFLEKSETFEVFLNERWKRPDLLYSEQNDMEIFQSDIPLKDGTLVLYPQFIITVDERIIQMIHIKKLYSNPVLKYDSEIQGFQISSEPWDALYPYINELEQTLSEKAEKIKIYRVILMELEYKNEKNDVFNTVYYKIQDEQIYPVSENDIKRRGNDHGFDLERPVKDQERIIEDCLEILKKNQLLIESG